jgi:hypothetical protein
VDNSGLSIALGHIRNCDIRHIRTPALLVG